MFSKTTLYLTPRREHILAESSLVDTVSSADQLPIANTYKGPTNFYCNYQICLVKNYSIYLKIVVLFTLRLSSVLQYVVFAFSNVTANDINSLLDRPYGELMNSCRSCSWGKEKTNIPLNPKLTTKNSQVMHLQNFVLANASQSSLFIRGKSNVI